MRIQTARGIRDTVRIGQIWRRRSDRLAVYVRQIHRADQCIEVWFLYPDDGPMAGQVQFRDLKKNYELQGVDDV